MDFKKVVKERKSIREFSSKKPSLDKVMQSIESARLAPAAGNQNILKYILVDDKKIIEELALSSKQKFISQASYVIAIVSDPKILKRSYNNRGEKYTKQQAGAAIQNLLLAITNNNMVSCWVGYFYDEKIKSILEIPDDLEVEGLFPIGLKIPGKNNKQKRKPDLDNILFFNKFKNKKLKEQTKVRNDWV